MEDWEWIFETVGDDGQLTEKQKQIIKAAIETFAEKGYSATSTNEIAKKAGVAEGTIFRHFKTKKDLLIAIVTPVMKKLVAPFVIRDLNKVLDQKYDTFEAFLRALIENRKQFLERNFSMIKILVQEVPFHPELKALFQNHVAKEPLQKAMAMIRHFQEKGDIAPLSPATILRLVFSAGVGYLLARKIIDPEYWNDDEEMEATIRFILNGLKP
ncbi:TetR/AcrR family transcriptional regulator [Tuberibacillus calidus]|jgi:AcrR family transcriptional regulator|uniref:TetR/AcrR family transcriptional regulator n=1 Tax=Tuberibacillus calidus TaxID=340097 RepID=UPI00040BCD6F|nr:TetR/AcrR family transcriptional regulator [Tuberibacillus calidus]